MARKLLTLYLAMAMAAVALQWAFAAPVGELFVRPAPRPAGALVLDVLWGVGVGLLTVLATRWSSARFRWAQRLDAEFREALAPVGVHQVAALALMSSLAEELLFRGFLQSHLGLAFASVAFGLAHLPHKREQIPWTLAATLMGFVFGWLMDARGALFAPILGHFTINHFNLHVLLRPPTAAQA